MTTYEKKLVSKKIHFEKCRVKKNVRNIVARTIDIYFFQKLLRTTTLTSKFIEPFEESFLKIFAKSYL
jgi:hypothetical protein